MQVLRIQHVIYRFKQAYMMNIFKTGLVVSSVLSVAALFSASVQADQNELQQAYKSTNVKAALINICKTNTTKGGKLTAAEVNKFCGCQLDAEGKITNDQKWQIQSAINAKKSPSSLPFVQKQNADMKACLGPQLTSKLQTLTEAAIKAAQK